MQKVRVRVRSSKIEVRCASACETNIKVRVCMRHTVKFLATQHLIVSDYSLFRHLVFRQDTLQH